MASRGLSRRFRGLSPRVRGNRVSQHLGGAGVGPIPACAGQPLTLKRTERNSRAYPRVCGATRNICCRRRGAAGLSPRVRGNRRSLRSPSGRAGPIPACAGQPGHRLLRRYQRGAYPRVCGATRTPGRSRASLTGLSPRVRGNRCPLRCPASALGPIPACAGQPRRATSWTATAGAYPRVCGATPCPFSLGRLVGGLSPRVRGNPCVPLRHARASGPIPACAGQPKQAPLPAHLRRAYPRVCGATRELNEGRHT